MADDRSISTLQLPLVVDTSTGARDAILEAPSDAPGAVVIAELSAFAAATGDARQRVHCERTGRDISPDMPIASAGLLRGDRLIIGPDQPEVSSERQTTSDWEIVVVGGPAAGRRFPLAEGETVVGRGPTCTHVLEDPALSDRHLAIRLRSGAVTVSDAGSRNGTAVEGVALTAGEEHELAEGSVVRAGRSLLAVGRREPGQPVTVARPDGSLSFNRPPRISPPFAPPHFALGAPPSAAQRARLPLAASLMPIMIGVILYLVTSSVTMLIFTALSPLMALGSFLEDRRGGKGHYKRGVAEFRTRLRELKDELDLARAAEGAARRAAAPSTSELLRRAVRHDPRLWERRPEDADFLAVRLGSADRPSDIQMDFPPGGSADVRAEADELIRWYGSVPEVPVTAPLRELGVFGVAGAGDRVDALARNLVFQLAALHSPGDLMVAAAIRDDAADGWRWLKWLPHVRDDGGGIQVAVGRTAARSLVEAVVRLLEEREAQPQQWRRDDRGRAILVLLDSAVAPERVAVAPLLERGPAVDIFVVWLGSDRNELPGTSKGIAELDHATARLTYTEAASAVAVADVTVDALDPQLALEGALALAPLEDVSADRATVRVPARVSLLELLEAEAVDAQWVSSRWSRGSGLGAVIGAAADGAFAFDLRADGPHGLVAGTTGAGKSELLQTIIASLAMEHPPTRLTFLLIDYKGGAAFRECVRLPHAVGFVTDLDEHLTRRALISLNAELKRREGLLRETNAKDLVDMERSAPDAAPPSLLIVIDEFATLAKEVPDFVQGVVDVAQRGRSLGVHLLLATQRPGGVVTDNIRANTNLRIALRVSDPNESSDVIGVNDAAAIPRTRPGRGLVRTGQSELTPFQSAYVGGITRVGGSATISVRPFELMETARGWSTQDDPAQTRSARSDLSRIVDACVAAAVELELPEPARPWLSPLPEVIPLATLSQPGAPVSAALGLIDEPARQRQRPFVLDLDDAGSVIVYGAGGSGKTSMLRTLTYALAERSSVAELNVYGLDFASRGLLPLEALPHCGSIVPGDDAERVDRTFGLIRRTIDARREAFAAAGVFSLAEFRRARPDELAPHLLVLLDGYAAFVAAFERVSYGALVDAVPRLVADGRPVGVHFAITSERRGGVPNALTSAAQSRVILRMPNEDDYAALGLDLRAIRGVKLPPGRGFVEGTLEAHFAIPGDDATVEGQSAAVSVLARESLARKPDTRAPKIQQLPSIVSRATLPPPSRPLEAVLGIGDSTLEPLAIDLSERHFLVAGAYRSGRSTALRAIAQSLRARDPDLEVHLLAPRRSPLPDDAVWTTAARGLDACAARIEELKEAVERRIAGAAPMVIVVDDGEELTDSTAVASLETIIRRGRDADVRVVVAAERACARSFSGWPRELRKDEHGLLLQPDDADSGTLNTPLPRKPHIAFAPGRGFVVYRGTVELVQVATD